MLKHLSSTKGVIAGKNKKGWLGVYNHYDSYPSGLGQAIWDKVKWYEQQGMSLQDAVHTLVSAKIEDVPQGYSSFPLKPYSKNEPSRIFTSKTANPMLLEWIYVIDPDTLTMRIMRRVVKRLATPIPKSIKRDGKKWYFEQVVLWHTPYAKVNFRDAQFKVKDP